MTGSHAPEQPFETSESLSAHQIVASMAIGFNVLALGASLETSLGEVVFLAATLWFVAGLTSGCAGMFLISMPVPIKALRFII
ncbi:hypothetical protein PX699_17695 [Sphingobium sp. H39-3-25]|uniref:hypothetical protein n=1 Tax=Sphingobium arseniciresistens TaxID=3030834 RepID=UPI0023BA3CE7|nr:hypothetical protein [Sphingobium arseniciresistens]